MPGGCHMHDMSVAHAVTEAIIKSLGGKVPESIDLELEVGKLRFHDTEQVEFWIAEMLRKEIGKGIQVRTSISIVEPTIRCECGYEGSADGITDNDLSHHGIFEVRCPKCGSMETSIKNGKECRIVNLSFR